MTDPARYSFHKTDAVSIIPSSSPTAVWMPQDQYSLQVFTRMRLLCVFPTTLDSGGKNPAIQCACSKKKNMPQVKGLSLAAHHTMLALSGKETS